MKFFFALIFLCLLTSSAHAAADSGYRKHLPEGQSYGITFNRPDTSVLMTRFDRNDRSRFLSDIKMQELRNEPIPPFDGWYEKQRIEDGNNIFLCMRIKEYGIWTRKTYWIHYEENDTRPAFRERVYIDADTNDLSDGNDLLVFQANYYASEIFRGADTDDNLADSSQIAVLRYIESIIEHNFRLYGDSWIIEGHPAFPVVTSHVVRFYNSTLPRAIDALTNRIDNRDQEVYLGIRGAEVKGSLYILFHPVGNVKALHENGNVWIEYSTLYKSKNDFSFETKEEVKFIEDRDYFVGIHGTYKYHFPSGVIAEQTSYENGFKNGILIDNSEYEGLVSGDQVMGRTSIFPVFYDYRPQQIIIMKDSLGIDEISIHNLNDRYLIDRREVRRALQKYKRHCRKWKLEPYPSTKVGDR